MEGSAAAIVDSGVAAPDALETDEYRCQKMQKEFFCFIR
jgi:hypothetical protein